jgi:hypothetical protein
VKTGTAAKTGGGAARAGRSAADTEETAAVERAVAASRARIRVFMSIHFIPCARSRECRVWFKI